MLWLVLVCMAATGFGIGTLVIAFQVITEATMLASSPVCYLGLSQSVYANVYTD